MTRARDISNVITNADLAGDIDVDGTANLDIVDIDGTVAISQTLTVTGDIISNTSGISNFRAGVNAGDSIQSGGNYNVFIGDEAGQAITTGDKNVAIGFEALSTEDTHGFNVAVGYQSLKTLNAGQDGFHTAVGYLAGTAMTTGFANTFIGGLAGDALTEGNNNVGVGVLALSTETKGAKSVGVGYGALSTQNTTSASDIYNTGVGYFAGANITTGSLNTLVGGLSGDALTDGTTNCALGYLTLSAETSGQRNTAMGYSALANQNGASETQSLNTAYGFFAGLNITTGIQNVFIGANAGDSCTDDDHNTFVGYNSGSAVNGGFRNTFLGKDSGDAMTTGDKNVIIGSYGGNEAGLDIRTSSNQIVISDGNGEPHIHIHSGYTDISNDISNSSRNGSTSHCIHQDAGDITTFIENSHASSPFGLFIHFTGASPNNESVYFLACQDSSNTRLLIFANGDVENQNNSYTGFSDEKLKEQIKDASSQWEDIKALTIRNFKFKTDVASGDSDEHWRLGVVAQEVESAGMNGLVTDKPDRDSNTNEDLGTTTKSVKYSILYMKAVKALQEAMERIEILETKVKALEG